MKCWSASLSFPNILFIEAILSIAHLHRKLKRKTPNLLLKVCPNAVPFKP